jgi:phage terminase small subunit
MTPKQERFVQEYLIDLNATQAAIRAGYSEKTARQIGQQNLSKPDIAKAIKSAMDKREQRTQVTQDQVVNELRKIAFADMRYLARWGKSPIDATSEAADPNGLGVYPVELIPSEEIDEDIAAAISEVSLTQTGIKVKLHDKLGALEKLGKHLGIFAPEKHDHNLTVEILDI